MRLRPFSPGLFGYALASFVGLAVCFLVHRLLAFRYLAIDHELGTVEVLGAFAVGAMSDLWVAALGSTLVLLVGSLGKLARVKHSPAFAFVFVMVGFGALTAGHQAYVEFFHAPIALFHLRYLLDDTFLVANGASLFGPMSISLLILAVAMTVTLGRTSLLYGPSRVKLGMGWLAMMVLMLLLHNRNLHYRVQWFIPDKLQVNPLERLYLEAARAKLPRRLTEEDLRELEGGHDGTAIGDDQTEHFHRLWRLSTTPPPSDTDMHPVAVSMKKGFASRLREGRKPLLLIVLMESLRPSETGLFSHSRPSLTPHLDAFATDGIAFFNAFSTGVVTRGAQEAAFCGYLGSRDTSLMRGSVPFSLPCLSAHLQKSEQRGEYLWLHGGEGRFDSQLDFWRRQGVGQTLDVSDFPDDAPRTGWGVGDLTFLRESFARIARLHEETKADYLLGMLLTVSNHIPWQLPGDADGLARFPSYDHPSYLTTQYADLAFGELVARLKTSGLWRDTVIIVGSDHGNTVPAYLSLYRESPRIETSLLKAHVNLAVGGGIVDEALRDQHLERLTITQTTSQAGIASFLAYLIGIDGTRFMADALFSSSPKLPVLADVEDGIFNATTKRLYAYDDVLRGDLHGYSPDDRRAALHYRAFLTLISEVVHRQPAVLKPRD